MRSVKIGKATGIIIWFATHLNEELTTTDIAIKWGMNSRNVGSFLGSAIKSGLITREVRIEKYGIGLQKRRTYYLPGPNIHKEINR